MNTIKFNDFTCPVISFNKYTNFDANGISGTGTCEIEVNDNLSDLYELGMNGITSLQILVNDEVIYNLTDINIKITSINETLTGNRMAMFLNFSF